MKKYLSLIVIFSFLISLIPVVNAEELAENTRDYIFSEDFSEYGVTKNTAFRDYPKSGESNVSLGSGFSDKWSEKENEISNFTSAWPKLSTQLGGSAYGYGGVEAYRNIENSIDLGNNVKFIVEFTMSANTSDLLSGIKLGNIKIGNCSNKAVLIVGDESFSGKNTLTAKESYTYVAEFEVSGENSDKVGVYVYSTNGNLAESFMSECELGNYSINNLGMIFNSTPTYISKILAYEEIDTSSKKYLIEKLEDILAEIPEGTDYLTKDNYSEILNDAKIYVDKIKELYGEETFYEVSGYEKYHDSVEYNNSIVNVKVDLSEYYNSTIYASESSTKGENPNVVTGPNCGFEIDLFKAKDGWKNEWGEEEYNIYLLDSTEYLMRVKGNQQKCAYRSGASDRAVDIIDVKDGCYGELDLLVNTDNAYYSSGKAYVGIILQYADGERVFIKERVYGGYDDRSAYQNQISGTRISATDRVVDGTLYIHELKIPVDKTKTLASIEVLQSYATLNEDATDVSGYEVTGSTKQTYRATIYAMTLKQTVNSLRSEAEKELKELFSRLPQEATEDNAVYYIDVVRKIDELLKTKLDGIFINLKEYNNFSEYKALKEMSLINERVNIYVSPSGDDLNSGAENEPVKTFREAVERVEHIKEEYPDINIDVIFSGGEYFIDKTIEIKECGNGKVTYKAAEGEKVVIKGSVALNKNNLKKVTDEEILKRIPENARDKVMVIDLGEEGITSFAGQSSGGYGGTGVKYNTLFKDGKEETLARWPNSGYGKVNEIADAENRIISIDENLASRWTTAKEIVLDCFFSQDYACDKLKVTAVDGENATIKVGGNVNLNNSASGRFYAYNLIEELDVPGEYYIEDGMLYYYPSGDLKSLELSVQIDDFISIQDAENIEFSGLDFEKSCGNIFNIKNSENIIIDNCDFNDIGRYSVYTGNVNNMKVTNCDFYNLGNSGVTLNGGKLETLQSGNNEISNCTFNKFSQFRRSYAPAVSVSGVGAVVKNNVMHNSPHEAIAFDGNEHKILYNEIYDVCLETYDCAAIYGGRNLYKRGVEIAYNYIHDIKNEYFPKSTGIKGIYFDDRLSGGIVHHNIIIDVGNGIFVHGGQDMNIYENITVDCVRGMSISHSGYDGTAVFEEAEAWIKENPVYLERYPELEYVSARGDQHPRGNIVRNNILVNSGEVGTSEKVELGENLETQSIIKGNIYKESISFRDSENHDYTITDSSILSVIPGLASIDISKIGLLERESDSEISEFKKKRTIIKNDTAVLSWDKVENVDCYKIIISTDKDFKNILEEKLVYGEVYETKLEKGKPVFWKIYALKDSLNKKGTEESIEGATFIVSPKMIVETDIESDYSAVKARIEELFAKIPYDISYDEFDKYKDIVNEAENLISIGLPIPVTEISGLENYIAYKNAESYSAVADEYEEALSIIKSWSVTTSQYAYSKITEYGRVYELINEISEKGYDVSELENSPEFINMKKAIDGLATEFKMIDISSKFNATIYADKNTSTSSNPNVVTGDNYGFEINAFKALLGWKNDWKKVSNYFNTLHFDGVDFSLKVREGWEMYQKGRYCAWRTYASSESVLIDIEDGYYDSLSFLVNTDTKYYGTSHNTGYLGVIYVYDDGSEVLEYQNIYHGADGTGKEAKIECDKISTKNVVSGKLYLYKHDFTPDKTKKLTGIKILQAYAYLNDDKTAVAGGYGSDGVQDFRATIYSVTGEMVSSSNIRKVTEIEEKIKALPDKITASDVSEVDNIEILLESLYNSGIKYENIFNVEKYKDAQKRLELLAGIKVLDVDFGIYNGISAMSGKTVPIVAEVSNERYKDGINVKCYMALFDESGALKGVTSKEISLPHKKSDVFEFNFSVPEGAKDNWKFKIYFWSGQTPMCEKFNVN